MKCRKSAPSKKNAEDCSIVISNAIITPLTRGAVGAGVGAVLLAIVEFPDVFTVGEAVGTHVGKAVGTHVGKAVGSMEGEAVGSMEGKAAGSIVVGLYEPLLATFVAFASHE